MTTIDPNKTIHKYRREEEMRKALSNFIHRKHTLSVPPQVEDADMVISDVIEELLEARKKLALLEPLRNAWISELERREILRDRGDSWKVIFEPMIGPLAHVETPIRGTESAIATREEAEKAANAELTRYRSLPTSSLLHQIPVISTQEELREAKRKGEQYIFVANPGDSLRGVEELRESVRAEEEQEIDFSINLKPSIRFTAEVARLAMESGEPIEVTERRVRAKKQAMLQDFGRALEHTRWLI